MTIGRRRLSGVILVASAATMIAMAGHRLLADASFWQDEASIAYNLISMSPADLLGRLDSGHQFPRLYLAVLNQLRFVFGYETLVLRALPFAFFVAGVLLWHRLLWLRFRERPAVVALGVTLCLVPGDWFAYGAMLKQYSLDVFVALLPFTLTDADLDRRWRRGEGTPRLLPWLLPCLVSLTYGIALLGRAAGYALGTARDQGLRAPLRAHAWLLGGFAVAMALSGFIDLRHAFANEATFAFWRWRGCVAQGDVASDALLVARWLVDWYRAPNAFGGPRAVPDPVVAIVVVATALGAARVVASAIAGSRGRVPGLGAPPSADAAAARAELQDLGAWGTRGLSALVTVGGLFGAGLLLSLPLCANRLTLFAYFSLVWVGLEGASWGTLLLESRLGARWPRLLPAVLAALVLPSAASTVGHLLTTRAPEDVRPLLPIIASEPDRTIVVGRCSSRQLLTLPEWLARDDVFYVDPRYRAGEPTLPAADEFWLVNAGGGRLCPAWTRLVRESALEFRPMAGPDATATLTYVRMPSADGRAGVDRALGHPPAHPPRPRPGADAGPTTSSRPGTPPASGVGD